MKNFIRLYLWEIFDFYAKLTGRDNYYRQVVLF